MTRPLVTVSLLCLNQWALTARCLSSLVEATTVPWELLIWDNGSTDETREQLRLWDSHTTSSWLHRVVITRRERNEGFITPHNAQVAQAMGQNVCLLNNDIEVRKDWVQTLLEPFARDPRLGVVGVRWQYGFLNPEMVGGPGPQERPVEYVEGFCLMMPTALARRVGPFDAHALQWATGEDSDLSLRLRQQGWNIHAVTTDLVVHKGRGTMDTVAPSLLGYDPVENERRNRDVLRQRWLPYLRTRQFTRYRIIVKRDAAYGDVLCTEPVLRGLREQYPWAELTMLTQCTEILHGCPVIDHLTSHQDVWKEQFDRKIDLDNAYERVPLEHLVSAYCTAAGVPWTRPRFYLRDEGRAFAARVPTDRPLLVLCADGSWGGRTWPKDRFRAVAMALRCRYVVAEVGRKTDLYTGVGWNLIGRTTLQQLGGLVSRAALFVGCDNLLVHLAGAFEVPSVVVMGMTSPELRCHGPEQVPVQAPGVPCLGCHHRLSAPRHHSDCDQGRHRGVAVALHACMLEVSVEQVLTTIASVEGGRHDGHVRSAELLPAVAQ